MSEAWELGLHPGQAEVHEPIELDPIEEARAQELRDRLSTDEPPEWHRPESGNERLPASRGMLWRLNRDGLLQKALDRQRELLGVPSSVPVMVTRLTAWEVISDQHVQ